MPSQFQAVAGVGVFSTTAAAHARTLAWTNYSGEAYRGQVRAVNAGEQSAWSGTSGDRGIESLSH